MVVICSLASSPDSTPCDASCPTMACVVTLRRLCGGRPGRELLRRLSKRKIHCTYILLNGLSYVMKDVTKCFLGAAAMMSNGTVVARVGTVC